MHTDMQMLAARIKASGAAYDANADLPRPNIYLCSVLPVNGLPHHTYAAAEHTAVALAKTVIRCQEQFGFTPNKANCVIKIRRLRLGDIIEEPAAYDQAAEASRVEDSLKFYVQVLSLVDWVRDAVFGPDMVVQRSDKRVLRLAKG